MPKWKHGTARNQFQAAMRRSAEARRCPKCNRKSALKRIPADDFYLGITYCRWEDCDYERHHPAVGGAHWPVSTRRTAAARAG